MTQEPITLETRINTRLTDLLFRNVALSQGVVLINGLVVYMILLHYGEGKSLGIWLISVLLIALLRMLLAKYYWKRRKNSRSTRNLLIFFYIATYMSSAIWGLLILLLPQKVIWIESLIAFVIAGMSAGSLITNSTRLTVSVPYLLLILSPLIFYYAEIGDPPHLAMTLMVTLFVFLLIRLAFRIHAMQYSSIKTELENTDMFQVLKKAKQNADDMRSRLKKEVENLPEEIAQLDVFFNLSPNLLCVTDVHGNIIKANPVLREAMGLDRSDSEQENIFNYLDIDNATSLKNLLEEATQNQDKNHCQLRLKYIDGKYQLADFHIYCHKKLYYFYGREVI